MITIIRRSGFRGQRGTPVTPRSLGTGLKLWLRADLGVTKSGADVTGWQDQAATGIQWSKLTASPQYSASEINGQPGIVFSAANQALGWASGSLSIAAPWTWIVAFKSTVPAGAYPAGYTVFVTGPTSGCTLQRDAANTGGLYTYLGPTGNQLALPSATLAAGVVGRLSSSAKTPQQALNATTGGVTGSDITIDITGTGGLVGLIAAGGGSLTICELIIASNQGLADRLAPYIQSRYGLTLS